MNEKIKAVIKLVYASWIYPYAKSYVDSTDNPWDDKALAFLDSLLDDYLNN